MRPSTHLIFATIPPRRRSAEALLRALVDQTAVPDVVHLCLEGYGTSPFEYPSALTVLEHRTERATGPGARWRVLSEVPEDAVVVVLDDDQVLFGRGVVEAMVSAVASGGAAARMGTRVGGGCGVFATGTPLLSLGAAYLVAWARDLAGLEETRQEICTKCGFDPFGDCGDDEAVVSAHLWKKGVPMRATGPLEVAEAPGTRDSSQYRKRMAGRAGRSLFWQREEIARVTGWPWRE